MTKIVVRSLKPKRAGGRKATLRKRRVAGGEETRTVVVLDANSRHFGDDLLTVFKKNVARARNENKRIVGSPDLAIRKA